MNIAIFNSLPYVLIFILGSCIGSFLNVCIYRLPKNESIVYPRSKCPRCRNEIKWYDNIPLLSFIALRRRCRYCREKISFRYFFVELLTALLFLVLFYYYGTSIKFIVYSALFSALVAATFIDFEIMEIPDSISITGVILGLALSPVFPVLHNTYSAWSSFLDSILGILIGGGMIYLVGVIGEFIFKKEAMGGGDVKLLAMIGAFLGWKVAVLTFFIAPFFGAIFGLIIKIRTGKSLIPYGPFLALGSLVALLWGANILDWIFYRRIYM